MRLTQEAHHLLGASLDYIVSFRPVWTVIPLNVRTNSRKQTFFFLNTNSVTLFSWKSISHNYNVSFTLITHIPRMKEATRYPVMELTSLGK